MDLETLDKDPESFNFSSASTYEVTLAQFHNSHGLPTVISGDKAYAEDGQDKARRKYVARHINIWN